MLSDVKENELAELYAWVDTIPLSKPKKAIARDFADAVAMAELVHHYFPRMVELHNYSPTSNSAQKVNNWLTLNQRVFKKLGFTLPKESCEAAAFAEPGAIERILKLVRSKLAAYQLKHGQDRPAQLHSHDQDGYSFFPRDSSSLLDGVVLATPDRRTPNDRANNELIRAYPRGSTKNPPMGTALPAEEELEEVRALNKILEVKAGKLEQLMRLKDAKIAALTARLRSAGLIASCTD